MSVARTSLRAQLKANLGNARGFTLLELTIAMVIATVLMLLMSNALVHMYQTYQSGVAIRATQDTARQLVTTIDNDARNTATVVTSGSGATAQACLYSTQNLNSTYDGFDYYVRPFGGPINGVTPVALYRHLFTGAPDASCAHGIANNPAGDERLSPDSVSILNFQPQAVDGSLLILNMEVASSAGLDLINFGASRPTCKGGAGFNYCSITPIDTSVVTRVAP